MFYVSLISDLDGTTYHQSTDTRGSAVRIIIAKLLQLMDYQDTIDFSSDHPNGPIFGFDALEDVLHTLLTTTSPEELIFNALGIRIYLSNSDFYR